MIEIPEEEFERLFYSLFQHDSREYDDRWQIIDQLFCQMMGWA